MTQLYGNFREVSGNKKQEFLHISFSPSLLPIQQRWRNNGLSADFAADYLTTFFPVINDSPGARRKQAEIKSAVSYIANELLENAMKFNYEPSNYSIQFGMHLLNEPDIIVLLYTTNSVSPDAVEQFETFIQTLITADPGELFMQQLEKSAESEDEEASMLGLLTMMNDYSAKLGWKFETIEEESEIITVTTMVQLYV